MITRAIVERSNQQNNVTSTENTRGGYFLHFDIIGANLIEGFGHLKEIIITYL